MRQSQPSAIWSTIEAAMYANNYHKKELAKIAGVHANTITRDASDPSHIPLGRICLYCAALNISPDVLAKIMTTGVCG